MAIRGVDDIRKWLRGIPGKLSEEIGNAVMEEAKIEVLECKRRVPIDTGDLRNTIHAEGPFKGRNSVYAAIVAGGPTAPYAWWVHEDLEAFHRVGQAKYIESVLRESYRFMLERIAKRINIRKAV